MCASSLEEIVEPPGRYHLLEVKPVHYITSYSCKAYSVQCISTYCITLKVQTLHRNTFTHILINNLHFKLFRITVRPYPYSLVREARIYLEHHTFKSVSFNSPGSFSALVLIESVLEKSLLY